MNWGLKKGGVFWVMGNLFLRPVNWGPMLRGQVSIPLCAHNRHTFGPVLLGFEWLNHRQGETSIGCESFLLHLHAQENFLSVLEAAFRLLGYATPCMYLYGRDMSSATIITGTLLLLQVIAYVIAASAAFFFFLACLLSRVTAVWCCCFGFGSFEDRQSWVVARHWQCTETYSC